jgi:hypothetical protein
MLQEPPSRAGSAHIADDDTLLPTESTARLIHYLRAYASKQSNQAEAVRHLLRCSERTANRMLSPTKRYKSRIKVAWAVQICTAAGKTLDDVLPMGVSKSCEQALTGWISAINLSEEFQQASDCAQAICLLAYHEFKLHGWFAVKFGHGHVARAEVNLSPCPELASLKTKEALKYQLHQLIINADADTDGRRRMTIRHHHPTEGGSDKLPLTFRKVEYLIKHINALTKNHTADLKREIARLQAAQPG